MSLEQFELIVLVFCFIILGLCILGMIMLAVNSWNNIKYYNNKIKQCETEKERLMRKVFGDI